MRNARRLLNMVTEKYDVGSLCRFDANRHLFFLSTAQALQHHQIQQQQAAAPTKEEKAAPQKEDYGDVLSLPLPKLRFKPPPSEMGSTLEFFPFGGGGGGRILSVDEAGGAILYDADASTVQAMPSLSESTSLSFPASFAVTHGANAAHDPAHPDALYLMDGVHRSFQALVYGDPTAQFPLDGQPNPQSWSEDARSVYSGRFAWHWRQLPPPPVPDDRDSAFSFQSYADRDPFSLQSYALLHGSTICLSFLCHSRRRPGATYCFDTGAGEWTKAGDWALPFWSRALHVPELGDGLLFGIQGLSFSVVDVSDTMKTGSAAPVLRHKWVDVDPPPPPEWVLQRRSMAYLGAGRFCIHRGFDITARGGYGDWETVDTVTLLTGVEVVREAGSSKLRLVKHRTKRVDDIDHLL